MANYVLWGEAEWTHPSLSCLSVGYNGLAHDKDKAERGQGSRLVWWPTGRWEAAGTHSLRARPIRSESPAAPKGAEGRGSQNWPKWLTSVLCPTDTSGIIHGNSQTSVGPDALLVSKCASLLFATWTQCVQGGHKASKWTQKSATGRTRSAP